MFIDNLVRFLLPRENKFFIYLESMAKNVLAGAEVFGELRDGKGVEDFARVAERLRRMEHEGDEIAHLLYEELDKTFVTPIDREDLHALCSAIDSVLDIAEGCAARVVIYRLTKFSDPMKDLIRIFLEATREVTTSVALLRDLGRLDEIGIHVVHVNTLENEADKIYRVELKRLFADPPGDPIELIREKEILDALERAVDSTEDVMDLVRSICVKNG